MINLRENEPHISDTDFHQNYNILTLGMNIEYFDSDYGQNWFCDIILMEIMSNIHWRTA